MTKPVIFLSHITEEAELAGIFRTAIRENFLGLVDVFASSDPASLTLGSHWLDDITTSLRSCAAMLIFCSPASVGRPWINFECGAGWARGIEVAPICHSGIRPVDLPLPMNLLQGIVAADKDRLAQVFTMISHKLGCVEPSVDISKLSQKIAEFENKYVQETRITRHLKGIRSGFPDIYFKFLMKISPGKVEHADGISESLFNPVKPHFDALQSAGEIQYNYAVNGLAFANPGTSGGGTIGVLTLSLSRKLAAAMTILA